MGDKKYRIRFARRLAQLLKQEDDWEDLASDLVNQLEEEHLIYSSRPPVSPEAFVQTAIVDNALLWNRLGSLEMEG